MKPLFASLLLVSLVACGGKKDEPKKDDPKTAPDKGDKAGSGSGSATKAGSGSAGSAAGSGSAGSGAGSGSGSAGSGAGSGSAAPVDPSACIPSDLSSPQVKLFDVDAKAASLCLHADGDKAYDQCFKLDLAAGTWSKSGPITLATPALTFNQDPKGVQACLSGKCVNLDLPKPKPPEGPEAAKTYNLSASADGKLYAASSEALLKGVVQIVDATTGKKKAAIKIPVDGSNVCMGEAWFVGNDVVYVLTSVCAGPGGTGHWYHLDGKEFGDPVSGDLNPYGSTPVHVDGDQWAIADFNGGAFAVWDAKAGKLVKLYKDLVPEGCTDCALVGSNETGQPYLTMAPGGKIAVLGGNGVTVVDPKDGSIATKPVKFPMCPAPK